VHGQAANLSELIMTWRTRVVGAGGVHVRLEWQRRAEIDVARKVDQLSDGCLLRRLVINVSS